MNIANILRGRLDQLVARLAPDASRGNSEQPQVASVRLQPFASVPVGLIASDTTHRDSARNLDADTRAAGIDIESLTWRLAKASTLAIEANRRNLASVGACPDCCDLWNATGEAWQTCGGCEGQAAAWEASGRDPNRDPASAGAGQWHATRAASLAAGAFAKSTRCGSRIAEFRDYDGAGLRSVVQGCGHRGCDRCEGQRTRRVSARLKAAIEAHDTIEAKRNRVRRFLTFTVRATDDAAEAASFDAMRRQWSTFLALYHQRHDANFVFVAVAEPHLKAGRWHFHAVAWLPKWYPYRQLHTLWNRAVGGRAYSAAVREAERTAAAAAAAAANAAAKAARVGRVSAGAAAALAAATGVADRAAAAAGAAAGAAAAAAAALSTATVGNVDVQEKDAGRGKGGANAYLCKYLVKLAKFAGLSNEIASALWQETYGRRLLTASVGFWKVWIEVSGLYLHRVVQLADATRWSVGCLATVKRTRRDEPYP